MEAARHTFAHNAVDLLTDCPSRERAGWLSTVFLVGGQSAFLRATLKVERAFCKTIF